VVNASGGPNLALGVTGSFASHLMAISAQARRDNQTISFPQLGARVQLVATEYRKI
jgi:hypothetical protein